MPYALLLAALLLMPAFAQSPPAEDAPLPSVELERQWSGTVTSVQPGAGVFRMETGGGELEVIAGTNFSPGWSLEALHAGLNVIVSGVVESGGSVRARFVTVIAEPPEQSS